MAQRYAVDQIGLLNPTADGQRLTNLKEVA
jgi:hypothetical protein